MLPDAVECGCIESQPKLSNHHILRRPLAALVTDYRLHRVVFNIGEGETKPRIHG
jgi:hypothetical protein